MEEKKINKRIIFSVVAVLLLIAVIAGATYAYFGTVATTEIETITSGNLTIGFETGEILRTEDLYPIRDLQIDKFATQLNFTVKNTGNIPGYFDISLTDIIIDEELKDENFKWRLLEGDSIANEGNFMGIGTSKLLQRSISIDATKSKTYKLLVWISENDEDQNYMQGKSLTAKVSVNSRDRLTKLALSSKPVIKDTINGNQIQNLKIYGNTEDGVSVGTETNNQIDITVSGLNLLNNDNIEVPESTAGSLNNATVTPYIIDMVRKGQYDYAYIPVNLKSNTPYTLWYGYEVYDRSATTQGDTYIRTGFAKPITSEADGRATYTTNTTDEKIYNYTPTEDIITNVLFYANYGSAVPAKVKFKAMLLQGDYTLENMPEFEPYVEPVTYQITLSAPLRSNGDKKDYIDFEQGKVIRWIDSTGTVLKTPTEEPITLPTIKTLGGTNVISTNTKVKPSFEGGY